MSVYDLSHVTIEAIGDPAVGYRITSDEGWYIHLPEHEGPIYKKVVALRSDYDFSTVEIVAEADLPADAEICGGDDDVETETI